MQRNTGKYNVKQNACPLKGKLSNIQGIAPWEVNYASWHTMLPTLYNQEWSSALHETYPTIIVSDVVLPIWLELPLFTVVIKLLFKTLSLGTFLNKAWHVKVMIITLGTPYKMQRSQKHNTTF